MRMNRPLDKILNNEIKVRVLRTFCREGGEASGRQIARMTGVTPKTSHEILRELLGEGILLMRTVGKTYLFCLNEERAIVSDVLKPLFAAEDALKKQLLDMISRNIKKSPVKEDILSIALFGSVHAKTEAATSDVDLLVVVKTAASKKKVEGLFDDIDQQSSLTWGNLIAPYISSLAEFKNRAKKKAPIIQNVLKSYELVYGSRLERLLR